MSWEGPILTDSGGFQVFSLSKLRSRRRWRHVSVTHRRQPPSFHRRNGDGGAGQTRRRHHHVLRRMRRPSTGPTTSGHWSERTLGLPGAPTPSAVPMPKALFGIVRAASSETLRQQSAAALAALDLPGYAIGGLAVGETKPQMYATLDATLPFVPADRPRYLMGVGAPDDIVEAVARGIDLFDSVATAVARHGAFFTAHGRRNLRNARFADETGPLEPAVIAMPAPVSAPPTSTTSSRRRNLRLAPLPPSTTSASSSG
ncbi:MAG: tRNA-guanine transglycosylase [Caldilineales bacterium]|nr:tRNA-guanine transglycosylase [Caldilineales bacterium]